MTGADEVIASLPGGPACVLLQEGTIMMPMGDGMGRALGDTQWRRLHVSRTMCHLDKDIILLSLPTMVMTEEQEAMIFKYLRETVKKDVHKIVIITAHRMSISAVRDVDQVVMFSDEGTIVDQLSAHELIGQMESDGAFPNKKSLIIRRLLLTRGMMPHQR